MTTDRVELRPGERFLRLPEVLSTTGLKRSLLYEQIHDGFFPQPIKIGEKSSAWIESEVREWMTARVDEALKRRAVAASI
jgi:prophage regulatory protein